ncbi:MAG: hypothetical protein ACRCZ1_04095 [Cetobacterium sp.]
MGWIKIRAIRKEAVFSVTAGEIFNLESKTGKRFWNDPKFLISIPNYESKKGSVDTRVKIQLTSYPNFQAVATDVTNNGSMVMDVYVTEGDGESNFSYGSTWSNTMKIEPRHTKFIQKINKENNFSLTVPYNMFGNYKVFYMFNSVSFDKTMFAYDILHTKSGNTFNFKVNVKNAVTKNSIISGRSFTIPNPVFISCSYVAYSNNHGIGANLIYLYENGARQQCSFKAIDMYTTNWVGIQTQSYIYHSKNDTNVTIEYRGEVSGGGGGFTINPRLCYSYASKNEYTNKNLSDFEITALVIWGL